MGYLNIPPWKIDLSPWKKNMKLEDHSLWGRDGPETFQGLCLINIRGQQWQHRWEGQARESHCPTSTASTKTCRPQHPNHCEKAVESQEVLEGVQYTSWKTNSSHLNQKNHGCKKCSFFFFGCHLFRCEVLVSGRVAVIWCGDQSWSVATFEFSRLQTFNALFDKLYTTYCIKPSHRAAHLQIILYTKWHPWVRCVYFKNIP